MQSWPSIFERVAHGELADRGGVQAQHGGAIGGSQELRS
jgi:hypothetical protein